MTYNQFEFFGIFFFHFIITLHSIIWHGSLNFLRKKFLVPIENSKKVLNRRSFVFVHGRGGSPSDFDPLIENLRPLVVGFDFFKVNLGKNRHTSILKDVEKLKEEISFISNDYEIILVGLSKGGVVITKYIGLHSDDERIIKGITISSPLRGTKLADYLPQNDITRKEMGYECDFAKNNYKTLASSKIPFFHIVPKYDHLIIPSYSSFFPSTSDYKIYRYNGYNSHTGICYVKEVAENMAKWVWIYK